MLCHPYGKLFFNPPIEVNKLHFDFEKKVKQNENSTATFNVYLGGIYCVWTAIVPQNKTLKDTTWLNLSQFKWYTQWTWYQQWSGSFMRKLSMLFIIVVIVCMITMCRYIEHTFCRLLVFGSMHEVYFFWHHLLYK